MGRAIAGPQEAWDAGSGIADRGWGVGLLGGAARDAFPETRHQRDWVHKTANVLDALPKSVHRRAKKKAMREITEAENKAEASEAVKEFAQEFGIK